MTTAQKIAKLIPYIENNFVESETEYDFSLKINLWQHMKPTKKNIKKLKRGLDNFKEHRNKFIPKGVYVYTRVTVKMDYINVDIEIGEKDYLEHNPKPPHNLDLLLDTGIKFIDYLKN